MDKVMSIVNSPMAITLIAGIVIMLLNKLYAKKPTWKKYEGTIISAVKYAEKAIADDTDNKSMRKLDAALNYVVDVYEEVEKKKASKKTIIELKEAIAVKHEELAI